MIYLSVLLLVLDCACKASTKASNVINGGAKMAALCPKCKKKAKILSHYSFLNMQCNTTQEI